MASQEATWAAASGFRKPYEELWMPVEAWRNFLLNSRVIHVLLEKGRFNPPNQFTACPSQSPSRQLGFHLPADGRCIPTYLDGIGMETVDRTSPIRVFYLFIYSPSTFPPFPAFHKERPYFIISRPSFFIFSHSARVPRSRSPRGIHPFPFAHPDPPSSRAEPLFLGTYRSSPRPPFRAPPVSPP